MIVAVEGADGSGKSTQARMLAEAFGYRLQVFPDRRTPVGKLVDRFLKGGLTVCDRHGVGHGRDDLDEALVFQALMTANRLERGDLLRDAKRNAIDLVCDRYYQSGLVYGASDGLDVAHLQSMHDLIPKADLNILVQVPVETCVERMRERGAAPERYENVERLHQIVQRYDALWLEETKVSDSWVVVDGRLPIDRLHEKMCLEVMEWQRTQED